MAMDEAAKRRVRAGRLLLQGGPPAEVAAAVGAPRQTVYRWLDVLNTHRLLELRTVPATTPPPHQIDPVSVHVSACLRGHEHPETAAHRST